MFSVEEEGKEKLSEEEERRKVEAFSKQLTSLLKTNKLSLLEDLSHKFKLTTKEIVEKIKQLEQEHLISGIFDERGKYLVIEAGEWSAIKNYILARGRVKKTDIMTECAKLIKIPDNVEEDLLKLISEEDEKEKPSP
jgi:predicted transcriptional regulator